MKISPCAGAVLLALSTAAFAQRPPVYPLRSQTAATQSVDGAYCYWQARQQTGVDMTHLSQRPPRTKRAPFAPDAGKGTSEPPLPVGRTAPPDRAGGANGAGSGAASDPGGRAATSVGAGARVRAAPTTAGRGEASSASDASATAAVAGTAASSSIAASASSASGALDTAAPRLPPPPPPMTAYWQAYGDCMHDRGYGVQ